METNGTLIDDEMAQFLKSKTHFSFVSVSLDGAKPDTHDNLRGVVGCFQLAKNGLNNLTKAGFQPQVICTLYRGNVSEMTELIEMAENLGCGSVKFNHVQKIGRGERFAKKQGLGIEEIIRLYRYLESDIIPRKKIQVFFDIPYAFSPIRKLLSSSIGRCAHFNVIGLLSGGELALCGIGTTVPELIYGHIETNDLAKIWCENQKMIRLRKQIPAQLEGICALCLHRDICLGACIANNFHETGRLNSDYYFCRQAHKLGLFPISRYKLENLSLKKTNRHCLYMEHGL